jgi:uncharacterized protein (DUF1015 family)
MVDVSPFNGLIFNKDKAGELSALISPPYDVISEDLKKDLSKANQYNIVKLILPEGDDKKKYQNAKILLTEWIDEEILKFDDDESYYMIEIGFRTAGKERRITGFIGLTKIEPYSKNIVLRHEKTMSKPKKDRYELLKTSRTNFGLIYTIYRDRQKQVPEILESYKAGKPIADIKPDYDNSISLKLWKITNKKDISNITDAMSDKKILIADGHHRYETSLMYKDESVVSAKSSTGPSTGSSPEEYVLTLLVESSQEDIRIYPTYRSIKFKHFSDIGLFLQKSSNCFEINKLSIKSEDDITDFLDQLAAKSLNGFIFYAGGDKFYRFIAINPENRPEDCGFSEKILDVDILHQILIGQLEDLYGKSEIKFNHDFESILDNVKNGDSDLGIFLNPPTIDEMEEICNSGKLMPQKSTFFWPKPPTGLVMYKFDIKK